MFCHVNYFAATLKASVASWPMGQKAYLELSFVLSTQLQQICKGLKCNISVRACKVEVSITEIFII